MIIITKVSACMDECRNDHGRYKKAAQWLENTCTAVITFEISRYLMRHELTAVMTRQA